MQIKMKSIINHLHSVTAIYKTMDKLLLFPLVLGSDIDSPTDIEVRVVVVVLVVIAPKMPLKCLTPSSHFFSDCGLVLVSIVKSCDLLLISSICPQQGSWGGSRVI